LIAPDNTRGTTTAHRLRRARSLPGCIMPVNNTVIRCTIAAASRPDSPARATVAREPAGTARAMPA